MFIYIIKQENNFYYICPFTKYLNYYKHSSVNCLHSDFPNDIKQHYTHSIIMYISDYKNVQLLYTVNNIYFKILKH